MRKYISIVAFLPLVILLGSCRHFWGKRVRGDGNITTEQRNVGGFENLEVRGSINVYLAQGSACSVKIEGDQNLIPYIEVSQEGDKLIVRNRPGYNLEPSGDMRIYVTAPTFNEIATSGASDIIGQGKITSRDELSLSVSGVGDVKMELDAPRLKAEVSGSSSLHLQGQTKDTEIELSGVGNAYCYGLLSENTKVGISGAGSAEVYASVKLDAQVSGVGSIHYKGNPGDVSQQVSGAGSISKANE